MSVTRAGIIAAVSPSLLPSTRILEGIVTTMTDVAALDSVNIAPMGPMVDADFNRLVLRPFTSSTTYRNLKATGEGVFHITDDALLIARGAIGKVTAYWSGGPSRGSSSAPVRPADAVRGVVLTGACRYYEFRVISLDDSRERTRIEAQVVNRGTLRDFIGFNRARHAVLEAAILATRIHLTGAAAVLAEFDRLMSPIEKTGGEEEHQAMRELRAYVGSAVRTVD
jgi:hypothetical protein